MVKVSNEPLQPNPFTTYRDPKTGLWVVVKKTKISEYCSEREAMNHSVLSEGKVLISDAAKVFT